MRIWLLTMLLCLGVAGPAGARAFDAELRIHLGGASLPPLSGSGRADESTFPGFALPPRIFDTATTLGLAAPLAVELAFTANRIGLFAPGSGGVGLEGSMPLGGTLRVGASQPSVAFALSFLGQVQSGSAFSGSISAFGDDVGTVLLGYGLWRTAPFVVAGPTPATVSGSDQRTSSGQGTVLLVTPIVVTRSGPPQTQIGGWAELEVNLVPEPTRALLLLVGAALLTGSAFSRIRRGGA